MNEFKEHGVALFREALTKRDVAALQAVVDSRTVDSGSRFWCESHLSEWSSTIRDILLAAPIGTLVARTMEVQRLWLYEDTALVKEAGNAPGTAWHQDLVHYPARGRIATAWISLDVIDDRNGAVHYVPGSQAWGTCFEPVRFSDGKRFSGAGLTVMPEIDLATTISFKTRPGDVIIHDGLVIHGSQDQKVERRRRALAASYFGPDVVYHHTPFPYLHPRAPRKFSETDSFQELLQEVRI